MSELTITQYILIALVFTWSGFVRSGLGFGGAVLSLPFLLMIHNDPLVYLPIISIHLLVFSSITIYQNNVGRFRSSRATETESVPVAESTIDWRYLRYAIVIMIVPKLIGVFGLITLPALLMSSIIFSIVGVYSLTYIFNKPFKSKSKLVDMVFLMLGAYISGTSLIGAPLIISVFANHVSKYKLRDTLFALWFILVAIKMAAFLYVGIDLQLIHHLWLLPCAAVGHIVGLRFHRYILSADTAMFYRVVGTALLIISIVGLCQNIG
ncbi:permease [Gammaproteobacteria bacterium 45_16_T64]|nr:permease [Gammaproteobacteria bacterium 45_16_T64]